MMPASPFDVQESVESSCGSRPRSVGPAPVEPAETAVPRCWVRGIHKTFGTTPILRGVDLDIPEGQFAVLVGPSGCGKSTLLRLVAGLEQADAGRIHLAQRDVTDLAPRERDIAMVFQSYALYPHLSVRDNLAFGLRLRRVAEDEIGRRIHEVAAMLGLEPLLNRLPKQLSGGQRQRVAMGRAIVRRASLYLFDEPLSNLDAALRAEVRVDIRRLHDRLGATTLYVTHDQVEAMTLADTLWVLNGGRVEQKGPPLEVYERPRSKFVAKFLGSPPMNFFEGQLRRSEGQWIAEGEGLSVVVSPERFADALVEGRRVTMGVRPHDFEMTGVVRAAGHLRIDLVEALGFEAYAYGTLRAGGSRVIARLDAHHGHGLRSGERIGLQVDPERVHLFDAESGAALDEGTTHGFSKSGPSVATASGVVLSRDSVTRTV